MRLIKSNRFSFLYDLCSYTDNILSVVWNERHRTKKRLFGISVESIFQCACLVPLQAYICNSLAEVSPWLTTFICERTAQVLVRLRICAVSPEPLLFAFAITVPFLWLDPNDDWRLIWKKNVCFQSVKFYFARRPYDEPMKHGIDISFVVMVNDSLSYWDRWQYKSLNLNKNE